MPRSKCIIRDEYKKISNIKLILKCNYEIPRWIFDEYLWFQTKNFVFQIIKLAKSFENIQIYSKTLYQNWFNLWCNTQYLSVSTQKWAWSNSYDKREERIWIKNGTWMILTTSYMCHTRHWLLTLFIFVHA